MPVQHVRSSPCNQGNIFLAEYFSQKGYALAVTLARHQQKNKHVDGSSTVHTITPLTFEGYYPPPLPHGTAAMTPGKQEWGEFSSTHQGQNMCGTPPSKNQHDIVFYHGTTQTRTLKLLF